MEIEEAFNVMQVRLGLNELVKAGTITQKQADQRLAQAIKNKRQAELAKKHGYKIQPSPEMMAKLMKWQKNADIKELRTNLKDADRAVGKGESAHHIVATADFRPHAAFCGLSSTRNANEVEHTH